MDGTETAEVVPGVNPGVNPEVKPELKPIMVEVTLDPSDSKKLIAKIQDNQIKEIDDMAAAMKKDGGQAGGKSRRNKKSKKSKARKSKKARKSLRRK
jgi:hypothetical protein